MLKLTSLTGLLLFILTTWLISSNRPKFPWRTVIWGVLLQFIVAIFILKTTFGLQVFNFAQRAVDKLNSFAVEGSTMVFGPLANATLLTDKFGAGNGFILGISVFSTIVVISALSSLLYHWGWLQRVVQGVAFIMQRTMKTSGSESLVAAANIFMGQTEAPLVIKPYLASMTRSEMLVVMITGMATIAASVLAAYVYLGVKAGHLLTASVMSAPAALVISKIMIPETEPRDEERINAAASEKVAINSIDALCLGASDGLKLALNVFAMLVAFVATVALANYLVGLVGRVFHFQLSLQQFFGWLNAPFAWLIGIAPKDCMLTGQILGERIVLNEFVGYLSLMKNQSLMDERSFNLMTYALCGFANFGSIAIQIGGIGALVPDRRRDLAQLGFRAMIGGLLACYMTAAVAGTLL